MVTLQEKCKAGTPIFSKSACSIITMKKEIVIFDFHDRFVSLIFLFPLLKNIDNRICLRYNSKKRDTKEDWVCPLAEGAGGKGEKN